MNLLQMSVSGAVMIIVTIAVRVLLLHKLPKRTFSVLWGIVLLRLLVPYSLSCKFSIYSILTNKSIAKETSQNTEVPIIHDFLMESFTGESVTTDVASAKLLTVLWLAGVLLCVAFFTVAYIKLHLRFRESLPVDREYIARWLDEHKTLRRISVRYSDRVSTPLTYGVLRPVILLPKNFSQLDNDELKLVLSHEYVHIRYFDAFFKLALIATLSIHWFNPMIWIMFILANKDIEMSCDEAVIRMLGDFKKQTYAMLLIRMEERKSGLAPLNNNFCKNSVKERVIAIMNYKKITTLSIVVATCLIVGTTVVFATSVESKNNNSISQTSQPDNSNGITTAVSPNSETNSNITQDAEATNSAKESVPVEDGEIFVGEKSFSAENTITIDFGTETPIPTDGSYIIQEEFDENGNRIVRYSPIENKPVPATQSKEYKHEEITENGILRW